MATRLFVTGGSGFVGSRLLPELGRGGHRVIALDRSGSLARTLTGLTAVEVVKGDLLQPDSYREALSRADVVVHLAAATGRAAQADHVRINAEGTTVLLAQCRQAGVRKILFVSSIAVTFADTSRYYYAQTKILAEEAVRRSGLEFAILRPTMILGPGSPILAAFEKLACLPLMPVFAGGRTKVQPIHVDDVVGFISAVIDRGLFANETFEVGGPDVMAVENLLQRIRRARTGSAGRAVHIPLSVLRPPLVLAEAIGLGRLLPLTVGQLSSFRFDGVVADNSLQSSRQGRLRDVSAMLAVSADTPRQDEAVERECRTFTGYLLGCLPEPYVVRKYAEALAALPQLSGGRRFDGYLLRFARRRRINARLADAYARALLPDALVRKRMVLLLAILETCPPTSRTIDEPVRGRLAVVAARLVVRGCAGAVALAMAVLILIPARLALAVSDRGRR